MDNLNILVSADTNYLPPLGVMLHSLVSARNCGRQINVHLLCHAQMLDAVMLERLEKQLREYADVELHLVDVSHYPEVSGLYPGYGFTPAAYYRLLAPAVLPHLDKVLYLDCDIIIKDDISDLYDTDIGDYLLAASKDTFVIGRAFSAIYKFREYLADLGISGTLGYFNSGVMLMNLAKMREEGLCLQMIKYAQTHNCLLVDQDVLNYYCQGRVRYIDKSWNNQLGTSSFPELRSVPNSEWRAFLAGHSNEKIAHYTDLKPWNDLNVAAADIWWSYAKQTEWHELLLQRLVQRQGRIRSVQEEVDAALRRIYDADWLRGNLTELVRWNEAHVYAALVDLAHEREPMHDADEANLERLRSSRVVFYGAGYWCRCFLDFFDKLGLTYPSEIWDIDAKDAGSRLHGVPVRAPDFASLGSGDLVAITVYDGNVNSDVSGKCKNALTHGELKAALARALWLSKEEMF